MGIVTTHIPDRSHDWHAHFDWQDADALTVEGYGDTEESAVIDLLQNAIYADGDGSEQDEIIDLAIAGWQQPSSSLGAHPSSDCAPTAGASVPAPFPECEK